MNKPNILYLAVKAIVQNKDGDVLLLKQSDPTISGHEKFHPPGGILELGESVEKCLIREIDEETGLQVKIIKLIDVGEWMAERDGDVMQFVGLYYLCTPESSDLKLQDSEVSEAVWVNEHNLDDINILEPSKRIITAFIKGSTPIA